MDAIIGRYRVHLEDDGTLILKHPAGIAFDLLAEETLDLLEFLSVYRKSLLVVLRETDGEMERIAKQEPLEQKQES